MSGFFHGLSMADNPMMTTNNVAADYARLSKQNPGAFKGFFGSRRDRDKITSSPLADLTPAAPSTDPAASPKPPPGTTTNLSSAPSLIGRILNTIRQQGPPPMQGGPAPGMTQGNTAVHPGMSPWGSPAAAGFAPFQIPGMPPGGGMPPQAPPGPAGGPPAAPSPAPPPNPGIGPMAAAGPSPFGNNRFGGHTFGGNRFGGHTFGGHTFGGNQFGASARPPAAPPDMPPPSSIPPRGPIAPPSLNELAAMFPDLVPHLLDAQPRAHGGFLRGYADGGPHLGRAGYPHLMLGLPERFASGDYVHDEGDGDGRSDNINARLSPGEFVMDAETTSLLGNGNSNAGARKWEELRQLIRRKKGRALAKGKFSPDSDEPTTLLRKVGV